MCNYDNVINLFTCKFYVMSQSLLSYKTMTGMTSDMLLIHSHSFIHHWLPIKLSVVMKYDHRNVPELK